MSALSETQAVLSTAVLEALVRDFHRDPPLSRARITTLLQAEPEGFYQAAIGILKMDLDSGAARYIAALLVYAGLLFRALCDPTLDRARALELAQLAQRDDRTLDVKLARELADTVVAGSDIAPEMAARLLEIIDRTSKGQRIMPSLRRMLRNSNPLLRSKVVLMIGRAEGGRSWLEKHLQEPDARVRANAIEAMWCVNLPEARELMLWATKDSNNRVVGNALLGLYRMGEVDPLVEIVRMAGHDCDRFRRTAAWVMGQIGDPRFGETLGRLIADGNANVRKSAFVAAGRVRESATLVSREIQWPLAVAAAPMDSTKGERRVSVTVVTNDSRGDSPILPAEFHLSENGQLVWAYRVVKKAPPGPLSVVFLFPRRADSSSVPWDLGALRCMPWKRAADQWSSLPYASGEDPYPRLADLALPAFISDSARPARAFRDTPMRMECPGFWTAVHRGAQSNNGAHLGQRHMIVVAPEDPVEEAADRLTAAVQNSRVSVQIISAAPNPALQAFCQRIKGRFQIVKDSSAVEEAVSLAYLSLLARYEISYQPLSADASSLKVRVHTPKGWGEAIVDL